MKTVLTLIVISASVFLNAQQLKYHYMEDRWQFAREDEELNTIKWKIGGNYPKNQMSLDTIT
jgi:hypothetical protein